MRSLNVKEFYLTLSGATTPGQSRPGSYGNEVVFNITQSSSITRTSPSDCLVSYAGHSLGGLTPLQRSNRCILQSQPTGLSLLVWDFACLSLENPYNFFFILVLFVLFLVTVISLSLLFFYVVFETTYRCNEAIFNAGESFFSFSWRI